MKLQNIIYGHIKDGNTEHSLDSDFRFRFQLK